MELKYRFYNSLPVVDLSTEITKIKILDKNKNQYLGHVNSVLTNSGKIIVVYPKGHGEGEIILKKSLDEGKSWFNGKTPNSWKSSRETPTVYEFYNYLTDSFNLILFSGLYPIRSSISLDDGESWSELKRIGDYGGIVAMSDLIQLNDGRLLAFFHDDGRYIKGKYKNFNDQQGMDESEIIMSLYYTISEDYGKSWSHPYNYFSSKEIHLCEAGGILSQEKNEILLLMRENKRSKNSHFQILNLDDFKFSEPLELPLEITGDRHILRYLNDGRVIIVYREMSSLESQYWGDWFAYIGYYNDLLSSNKKIMGNYRIRLADNLGVDGGYSGVEILDNNNIFLSTYGKWNKEDPNYIIYRKININDVEKKLSFWNSINLKYKKIRFKILNN